MVYSSAFRTATQLTGIARAAADALLNSFVLPSWLPSVNNFGLSYDFDINALQLTDAATFRAYDAEAPFGKTAGAQTRQGKLPAISRKLRVGEFDQLTLFGQSDAIGAKFEDYAERLGGQVAARIALAQGQGVETGQITLNENKLIFTIDFGRAGGNAVTAGTVWSTITANALGDLTTWRAAYVTANGFPPAVAMISTAIMSALQKNQSIITAATGLSAANQPTIISQDQVKGVFQTYGFGRVVINDDQVTYNGAATRIISSNKMVWLPESGGLNLGGAGGVLGHTDWGIPAEAINSDYGITGSEMPGIFSAAFHDEDPEGHNVLASAIALPVVESANSTFAATVI
jgi:hypothetical protein